MQVTRDLKRCHNTFGMLFNMVSLTIILLTDVAADDGTFMFPIKHCYKQEEHKQLSAAAIPFQATTVRSWKQGHDMIGTQIKSWRCFTTWIPLSSGSTLMQCIAFLRSMVNFMYNSFGCDSCVEYSYHSIVRSSNNYSLLGDTDALHKVYVILTPNPARSRATIQKSSGKRTRTIFFT